MENHTNVECQPLNSREAVCFLFCRQLLEEGLLIKSNNNTRVLNNVQISPPSPEPIRNDAEKTTAVASADEQRPRKKWDAADYAPIEVYIDSTSPLPPIASSQPSTLASSSLGALPATTATDDDDLSQISPTLRDLSEAEVMSRIRELRAQGRWSATRLPLCVDAPRPKTNWDFLLEEMCVMHADFYLERVRKQQMAKMLAHEAARYVRTTKLRPVVVTVNNSVVTPVGERTTPRKRKQTLTVEPDETNKPRKRRRRGSNNLKEELQLGGFEAEVEEAEDAVLTALNANTKPAASNGFDLKADLKKPQIVVSESENGAEENGNQLALSHDSGVAFDFSPIQFDPDDLDTDLMQTLLSAWDCDESFFSASVCDSLNNPMYTGPIIEPDRLPSYAELQFPLFAYDDQENLYDGMDPHDVIGDISDDDDDGEGGEMSPKTSTDESPMDSGVPSPTAMDELQPLATRNQNDRRHRASPTKRRQRRSEELKRLTGNQLFLTSEPNPVVLPDGKPGHTPAAAIREWTDCDVPPFTPVEEYELLSTVMKQLAVIPLPMYIARNFCVNWEMVAMRVEQRSFHGRSPHRCCVHFRQLLGAAKKMPLNDGMEPLQLNADEIDEFDVAYAADPKAFEAKVSQSSAAQARCFVRAVTMKRKKHAELPRQADVWTTRMRNIDEAAQLRPYGILRHQIQRPKPVLNQGDDEEPMDATDKPLLWCRLLELHGLAEPSLEQTWDVGPMSVLTRRKRPLPFEISMVYYQYSRRLRLSRILAASKTFLEATLKPPEPIPLIERFHANSIHPRNEIYVRTAAPPPRAPSAASSAAQTPSPPPPPIPAHQMVVRKLPHYLDVNFHYRGTPRYETAVERRLFARDIHLPPGVTSDEVKKCYEKMMNLMKAPTYVMDIRNPLSNSQSTMRRMIRAASAHVVPRKPPRVESTTKELFAIDSHYAQRKHRPPVDERLHRRIRTLIDTAEDPFRTTRNGSGTLLPLCAEQQTQMGGIGVPEPSPAFDTSTRFNALTLSSPKPLSVAPVESNGMEEESERPAAPFALALFVRFDETDPNFQQRFTSDVPFALTAAPSKDADEAADDPKSAVQDGVLYVRPLFGDDQPPITAAVKEEPPLEAE